MDSDLDFFFFKCKVYPILASARCMIRSRKKFTWKASNSRLRSVEVLLRIPGNHGRL